MTDSTIGGLPRAESINDDSLLVMEQQGEPKSVEAGTLMKYATRKVKGGQADWDAAEGESGHVLNRTHHRVVKMEEFSVDSLQLFAEDNERYNIALLMGGSADDVYYIYKITDTPFTKEQLSNAQIHLATGNYGGDGFVNYDEGASQTFPGIVDGYYYTIWNGSITQEIDWGMILSVLSDLEIPGFGTVKQGTYMHSNQYENALSALWRINNKTVYPLDDEYTKRDVYSFRYAGYNDTRIDVPIEVGSEKTFELNSIALEHIKSNRPFEICLFDNSYVYFTLRFPIRDHNNSYYSEQVIYSSTQGVLFLEFYVSGKILTIKVDNLADKMGCITSADTVNVAEEGM